MARDDPGWCGDGMGDEAREELGLYNDKKPQSTPKSPPRAGQELLGAGEGTQNIGKHHQGCLEGPAHVPAEQESEVEAPPAPAEI